MGYSVCLLSLLYFTDVLVYISIPRTLIEFDPSTTASSEKFSAIDRRPLDEL